ncbi:MAG: hypothetical protein EBU66_04690 [Bacteroidetes bacterium]|nr:hypothetical protein [bacterium]NBP63961.1 hypothetical protein [Bacteroidota bacterium]
MASSKNLQPFYKNWFFWVMVAVAVGYFSTRNSNKPAPTVDYMTALKDKAFAKLDSGIVSDKLLNAETSEDDKEELFVRIPLDKLKPGTVLEFGSSTDTNHHITVTLLSEKSAEVTVHDAVSIKGDSTNKQEKTETGTYSISVFEGSQILTDNVDNPLMQKAALILENLSYGADKGHPLLSKKYCIGKSKNISGVEAPVLRMYPWLDPINYPKSGQEFSFEQHQVLFGLSIKR